MSAIESQLNEALRDALVSYYLGEVVPNDKALEELGLTHRLKTPNDLYEYLLLDTQVTQDVQTSRVASAISSIQQYVNGVLLGMEPGYQDRGLEQHNIVEWRDQKSQYPVWAANQQLTYYPEVYIDPSLRLKKSAYFAQLEQDINQNKIELDTTQEAVKTYLASFEEVANLSVINGYVSSDDFANGTYYFIGKSRAENAYYWRTVDMSQRNKIPGPNPNNHKIGKVSPLAWSDWKPVSLPASESTLENTIRPVFFNNRLFVIWVDCLPAGQEGKQKEAPGDGLPQFTINPVTRFRLNLIYKKYDHSWSAPLAYLDVQSKAELFKPDALGRVDFSSMGSLAFHDATSSPDRLFLGMYAGYQEGPHESGMEDTYAFLHTIVLDQNFNITRLFPSTGEVSNTTPGGSSDAKPHVLKMGRTFANDNKERFQFRQTRNIGITLVTSSEPNKPDKEWNLDGTQNRIADMVKGVDVVFDAQRSEVRVTTKVKQDFTGSTIQTIKIEGAWGGARLTMQLISDRLAADKFLLLPGSSVKFSSSPSTRLLYIQCRLPYGSDDVRDMIFRTRGEPIDFSNQNDNTDFDLAGCHIDSDVLDRIELGIKIPTVYIKGILNVPYAVSSQVQTSRSRRFQLCIQRPSRMTSPADGSQTDLKLSDFAHRLFAGASLEYAIPIDAQTLYPTWSGNQAHDKSFYVRHGAFVQAQDASGSWVRQGYARKLTRIQLTTSGGEVLIAPKMTALAHPTLGTAEFIDFSGSKVQHSDGSSAMRQPIRMNTLFVKWLIDRANIALENLLSWDSQQKEEPPMIVAGAPPTMDFDGANGLYFWELFLHLPFLISHRLNLEQQFDEAESWLGFIFDPARKADQSGRPNYWNVKPLDPRIQPLRDYAVRGPVDPDGIASSEPVRYRKAVYFHYIKNLIDRGDQAYRELTPDSLGAAKLWYVRVQDLLGPRPDIRLVDDWTPRKLLALENARNQELRRFEIELAEHDQARRARAEAEDDIIMDANTPAPLALSTFVHDPTLDAVDNPHFRLPLNAKLVAAWDRVESRLFNLRHNRSIDGKPLSLPLFAAPRDPAELLARFGQAGQGQAARMGMLATPHYRFAVMLSRAGSAVDTLIQFGQTLLSLLERKEHAELAEMQQAQAWAMAEFAIVLQKQAIAMEESSMKALLASKALADGRAAFYAERVDENVSSEEVAAGALHLSGRVAEEVGSVAGILSSATKMIPSHYGFTAGMSVGAATEVRVEGAPEAASRLAYGVASAMHGLGEALDRTEQYRRRRQEWTLARDQARLESAQIDAQVQVLNKQAEMNATQLSQAMKSQEQAKDTLTFLSTRFTKATLYQWLSSQASTFYYQAYDAVMSLCLAAESCWQYEMADYTTSFVRPGAWNDSYRGLLAGESLKLNLLKMEAAYLSRNERLLEITRTISIRTLLKLTDEAAWQQALAQLQGEARTSSVLAMRPGAIDFSLEQALFDDDYPGHYLRRIKRIGVSLPVVLGPYQDIRATLTQTYNAVAMDASPGAARYLRGEREIQAASVKENLRANQQVALSSGLDDDGLFALNFDDERYLPFEGTGAVSRWTLNFPNHPAQQDMLKTLSDIIVHVRYTAKDGGSGFTRQIAALNDASSGS